MTNVTFKGYSCVVKGHAGFNPGNDIVCSAVSTLANTLVNTLVQTEEIEVDYKMESGNVEVYATPLTPIAEFVVKTVFKTIQIGYQALELSYPNNVKIDIS